MEFFTGYILGLAVAVITIIANHSPVTAYDIEQAQVVCAENKGLREIENDEYRCINGAVFEKGENK